MANLGSENTPIEGESFGLPSGYSFDEENGDLVIRDTDGTVAMRRADGTWELESGLALNENDISGVGGFDSESVNTEEASITGKSDISYSVPSDFDTLQSALKAAGGDQVRSGVRVILTIESGHDVIENVTLKNGDWTNVRVTSEDATVTVTSDTGGPASILMENANGPTWDVVFDVANVPREGMRLTDGSKTIITDNGGVINGPEHNVRVENSHLTAQDATFTGAGEGAGDLSDPDSWAGVDVDKQGSAFMDRADCSDSTYGVRLGDASMVAFRGGTATNCDRRGVSANRSSWLYAQGTDCSGADENCVYSSNTSVVDVRGGVADNAGSFAFRCRRGATILADRADATGAADGTFVLQGGRIFASDLPTDTDTDLWAADTGDLTPDQSPVAERIQAGIISEAGFALIDGETLPKEATWADQSLSVYGLEEDQSINAGEQTRVEFTTVESDPFDNWDSANYHWDVPFAGIWEVSAGVTFRDSADGDQIKLLVGDAVTGGDPGTAMIWDTGTSGNQTTLQTTRQVDVNPNDTLKVEVVNEDGADVLNRFDAFTWFQVSFVRFSEP